MTTIALDPALGKLLEELPREDPDKLPMADVWIALCQVKHRIPVNTPARLDFGEWMGPVMPARDVLIHARVGSVEASVTWEAPSHVMVAPGVRLITTIEVLVS